MVRQYVKRQLIYFFVLCIQELYRIISCIRVLHRNDGKAASSIREEQNTISVLVIRIDEIGDMVMLSPFLKNLRKWKPKAKITLVVKPQVIDLFKACPYIDDVKVFERCTGRLSYFCNMWRAYYFCKNELCDEYDISIVPRWDCDIGYGAGWVAMFSKASRRLAYSSCVNPIKIREDAGFDGFYTDVIRETQSVHEVERSLDILRYLGADVGISPLELWVEHDSRDKFTWLQQNPKKDGVIRIGLFLSCGMPRKEWDVSKYACVINRLSSAYDLEVILSGAGRRAEEYAEEFKRYYSSAINLVGKTSLNETVQLLKTCDCYLGGDTGPMHIAAACGIPGVALFVGRSGVDNDGSTPERFGPWMSEIITVQPVRFLPGCEQGCTKSYGHCINTIEVDNVYGKMWDVLWRIKHREKSK